MHDEDCQERGRTILQNITKESARAVQRGGHMDPKRKDWEGLHSCKSDLMASVCDKKDLFLFEIYYQQILSNEFTLR